MLGEKHDLIHELPEYKSRIQALKQSDRHFVRLFNLYHEIDQKVRNLEETQSPTSDEFIESLKKERLHLKDELFSIIQNN